MNLQHSGANTFLLQKFLWYKMENLTTDNVMPLLVRLHRNNDTLVVSSEADPELVWFLRSNGDPESSSVMNFDLLLQYDEEDDTNGTYFQIFNMDADLSWSADEEVFYAANFSVKEEAVAEELRDIVKTIQKFLRIKICDCARYFIKDDGAECYICMLDQEFFHNQVQCHICFDNINKAGHMEKMNCCHQTFHSKCLMKFRRDDIRRDCPICRKEPEIEVHIIQPGPSEQQTT